MLKPRLTSLAHGRQASRDVSCDASDRAQIAHYGFDHRSAKNVCACAPTFNRSPREKEVAEVQAIITPQNRKLFYLIRGEAGVGKSTLILQAAHKAIGGGDGQTPRGGIIYVKVPEDAKQLDGAAMGHALGAAFGHNFAVSKLWESITTFPFGTGM